MKTLQVATFGALIYLSQANPLKIRKVLREFTWSPFNVKMYCNGHLANGVTSSSVEEFPKKSNHLKVQAVLGLRR